MEEIGLAEAIRTVRQELEDAMVAGADEEIRFRVRSVELQFQIVVTKAADTSAKVRFWVVDVGAGAKVEKAATHTIQVNLDPVNRKGDEVEVESQERKKPL